MNNFEEKLVNLKKVIAQGLEEKVKEKNPVISPGDPPSPEPCVAPSVTPRPVPYEDDWGSQQMKCCKCLVYAEAKCGDQKCSTCAAWVMRNRRNKRLSDRWPKTPCGQAQSPNDFEGGWPNPKFKECWCGTANTDNPSVARCLQDAETACNRAGGGYFDTTYPNPNDPTGGANYFYKCGKEPKWMACNITAGKCKKVTYCNGCGNCYYACSEMPKPCKELEGLQVQNR
jgi:hypothetical protein